METSRHYECEEIPGGWVWWIHCPTCGAKIFIIYPRIRVIDCPCCGVDFIEGGI
jgi:hypothetical protein